MYFAAISVDKKYKKGLQFSSFYFIILIIKYEPAVW